MQKQKRWQLFLIIAVTALTIYNILPTVFYYTKPLKEQIEAPRAKKIASMALERVNDLEQESVEWIYSFCNLLKVKPISVKVDQDNPQEINVSFGTKNDAEKFRALLSRAGSLISFTPAQLNVAEEELSNNVIVKREIPIRFQKDSVDTFFEFSKKIDSSTKEISDLYKKVTFNRTAQIALAIGGTSEIAQAITNIKENRYSTDVVYSLAQNILSFIEVFGEKSKAAERYFASFTQSNDGDKAKNIDLLISNFESCRDNIKLEKLKIKKSSEEQQQKITVLEGKETLIAKAETILKRHKLDLTKGQKPWDFSFVIDYLSKEYKKSSLPLTIKTEGKNPFISSITIDWVNDRIILKPYEDLKAFRTKKASYEQLIINEIAKTGRLSDEVIAFHENEFLINLSELTESSSFLVLKLNEIAKLQAEQIEKVLKKEWNPKHPEFSREAFPIMSWDAYEKLGEEQKSLCLVVYAPVLHEQIKGLRTNSLYVVAKGIDRILQKYQKHQDSASAKQFIEDFQKLQKILIQNGFIGFTGSSLPFYTEFSKDFIFEKENYYNSILAATREKFKTYGSKKFAILEFTDVEQRILALNSIETRIHEDLLKWQDDYNAAQVSLDPDAKFKVPKPTKSIFLSNLVLSANKYVRGDERKIIHWGLDLSGGKTVQIELRDQNNRVVSNEADLKQGVNELYNRVNKMGVSEVNIRSVGSSIVLDFPGSQNLSASELVKASTMYFHVVNEKFSPSNPQLADSVNKFLQEVWNEAVVTNKKDIESINYIAYKHLYGASGRNLEARSEAAKILLENGLRLSNPEDMEMSSSFDDKVSKVAIFRGDSFTDWQNQTYPLILIFKNYALEGSNLSNVRGAYDPSHGNYLSFDIRGSYVKKEGQRVNPREELYAWTSHFAQDKIIGSPLEKFSKGKGWRMAVVLNDSIISSPSLNAAIKDSAMISGRFSQREINQMVADLKAGSLSFTPHILSEKNVSPELGHLERTKGVAATFLALFLVVFVMISYYRFAGIVAAGAVLFNLIIMWATLQNLSATLTLAGIAGIVLTVGIAVDANVLVFERFKEEFALSQRILPSILTGYKKAFNAIIDSNITNIIAALILMNFDAGPIKGFAVTLIIGIISSLFTALFMTRYFFIKWFQNPNHQKLYMLNLIKGARINFFNKTRYAAAISFSIIAIGSYLLFSHSQSIFGIDFTGGFALNIELVESKEGDYRQRVENALTKQGAGPQDFQVRELSPSNNLRLVLGKIMEKEGHPFYNLPFETDKKEVRYSYENNPRIVWVVEALNKSNCKISKDSLDQLNSNWTSISGQMSDSMRNNALFAMLLAVICILVYITYRFEFKFAISAIICLLHDITITVAMLSILNLVGLAIQIDMNTIAALMTIIGYSLNDKIIIFDRIREDLKYMQNQNYLEIFNHALNITLSRTIMTSFMTLLAILPLAFLSGSSMFGFALVMIIGIIFGTLSSFFIASPLLLFFHNKALKIPNGTQKSILG